MAESGKLGQMEWATAWIDQQRESLRQSAADGEAKVEPDAASEPKASSSFDDLLKTWRDAWTRAAGAKPGPAGQFSDLLDPMPAIGPWREHAETWRHVTEAQAQCQKLEQELRAVLFGVQNEALDVVQKRVRERQSGDDPVRQLRDLHKLWVECGEEVYAKVAHSDAYCKLQAEFGNATLRLRARQQEVIEHWLKQFDLPTRAELNTVHRQLREQKEKLREHKELLAGFIDRMKPSAASSKARKRSKPAPKPARKRASR